MAQYLDAFHHPFFLNDIWSFAALSISLQGRSKWFLPTKHHIHPLGGWRRIMARFNAEDPIPRSWAIRSRDRPLFKAKRTALCPNSSSLSDSALKLSMPIRNYKWKCLSPLLVSRRLHENWARQYLYNMCCFLLLEQISAIAWLFRVGNCPLLLQRMIKMPHIETEIIC